MPQVVIYGVSDDLIEIEGDVPGCDEYNTDDAVFVLAGPAGKARVQVWYASRGVWVIAVGQVTEGVPLLSVSVTGGGYSARAVVDGVDMVIREHNGRAL